MNDKNIKFKKSVNDDNTTENSMFKNPQTKDIAIYRLMKEYNITSEEAELALKKIEMKLQEKSEAEKEKEKASAKSETNKNVLKKHDNYYTITPQHVIDKQQKEKQQKQQQTKTTEKPKEQPQPELTQKLKQKVTQKPEEKPKEKPKEQPKQKPQQKTTQKPKEQPKQKPQQKTTQKTTQKPEEKPKQKLQQKTTQKPEEKPKEKNANVDEILSSLVPDYGEEVSIEVKNVNLTFDVEIDKIDTLKESFIRTLKRNKREKIKFQALKDISFTVYKGEKIGIIGYNGAGKSTLLKVIAGIYPPDTGSVNTYGNISPMLSLGAGFDQNYSGRKNIYLNGAVLGYSKQFLREKEEEIIEFSELGEFIDFPIKNYSSGMLAKLGFSIATMVDPDILIIDEVLGVGDVTFKKKSSDKIKSLVGGKTTVILVSHSIPKIKELCDKAIWIDQGRVREIGEVNEVCRNYLKDSKKATNEQLKNIRLQ